MSCEDLSINSVFAEHLNKGYGTAVDDCGDLLTKIGIHTFTKELSVLDFGADKTGVTDSTAAFTAAMAALPLGGKIIIPIGLYAVNLVITGNNYHFIGQQHQYSDTGNFGLTPFDASLPVVQIGNGTITTSNIRFSHLHIRQKAVGTSGTKGIRFYGCNRCYLDHCSIRTFREYQIQLDSSATKETDYIFLSYLNIATAPVTGSLGIDFNYGLTFTTAIFLSNSDISAANGGSYVIDLASTCELRMTDCYIQAGNNMGVHFAASSCKLWSSDSIIDSGSSNDILLTFDFDTLVGNSIIGNINIDGKASITSGNTSILTNRSFLPYQSLLIYPHIQGQLGFEDLSAALNNQHTVTDPAQNIYRDGTTLNIRSTDGKVAAVPKSSASGGTFEVTQGALEVKEAAIAGTGGLVLGSGTQTTVGAAGAASALPATPTGYLKFFIGGTERVIPFYTKS